jgi:limonene-1,2-epoxide hydrolase
MPAAHLPLTSEETDAVAQARVHAARACAVPIPVPLPVIRRGGAAIALLGERFGIVQQHVDLLLTCPDHSVV